MIASLPVELANPLERFRHELPGLIAEHEGEWAAVSKTHVLRIGPSQEELYAWCLHDLKLCKGDFTVRFIDDYEIAEAKTEADKIDDG